MSDRKETAKKQIQKNPKAKCRDLVGSNLHFMRFMRPLPYQLVGQSLSNNWSFNCTRPVACHNARKTTWWGTWDRDRNNGKLGCQHFVLYQPTYRNLIIVHGLIYVLKTSPKAAPTFVSNDTRILGCPRNLVNG